MAKKLTKKQQFYQEISNIVKTNATRPTYKDIIENIDKEVKSFLKTQTILKKIPNKRDTSTVQILKVHIFTPILFAKDCNDTMNTAPINQKNIATIVVTNTFFPFFHVFGKRGGKIFHVGMNNKSVAKIPKTVANVESVRYSLV